MTGYSVTFTTRAKKQLAAIPKRQQVLIQSWINANLVDCNDPFTAQNSKPLQATKNGVRYRVGTYRIIAEVKDSELLIRVVRVGHRQGVYKNLPEL